MLPGAGKFEPRSLMKADVNSPRDISSCAPGAALPKAESASLVQLRWIPRQELRMVWLKVISITSSKSIEININKRLAWQACQHMRLGLLDQKMSKAKR